VTHAPDVYAKLEDPMGVLAIALGQWEDRDDSKPQPEVRRAANTAMDAIDKMLAELHQLRARLVSEIRKSDDQAAARADRLLGGDPLAEARAAPHLGVPAADPAEPPTGLGE
jgi:hypothetical protein